MYETLNDVFQYAEMKGKKKLGVAAANDKETLSAVVRAKKKGLIEPILIGHKNKMEEYLEELGEKSSEYQLIDSVNDDHAAEIAVKLAKNQDVDFLMKGHLNTANMLRAVVHKNDGIAVKSTISHVNIMELEEYNKIFILTDVAIVIEPSLKQKREIIDNAVRVMNGMGYEKPKVALLCSVETVNDRMQETIHASQLKEMNRVGEITDCVIDGPISFDIAMNKERANKKHYEGIIKGDADILVVPNLVSGNLLSKALGIFGKANAVGFVTGASVPIVLTSRGSTAEAKYDSILACLASIK